MLIGFTHLIWAFVFLLNTHTNTSIEVFLIGDSTVSEYPESYYPRMGWGQALESFFQEGKVKVHNKAVSGRSTKSFIDEGLWEKVLNELGEGDYLLIQFGHNDMKSENEHLYAAPFGAYTDNLMTFIKKARAKKAVPVLVTPVYRRRFDDNGLLKNSHGEYPLAMRILAEKKEVPLIDLHKKSFQLFSALGPEKTKDIFLWLQEDEYENYPEGIEDNSHFSKSGAIALSELVAEEMLRLEMPLTIHLKEEVKK
ncbi:lysophospholipase L1-like esterase [Catalinimonas alkaloidigena]|uniref:rhamnogalacturonan acetylesterase n=1 Tax=Catalinimonas alkaloidigena TaxID=1075417 RepID=UPI0024069487|nr:rhamnogalacturonan acetylesterase [Catalinimonas alkaloidigena]MDF9800315.1 lysophospholipase L1-like esterase [Catalinimonas alkaloidigena]